MIDSIIKNFDVWTDAQGIKSRTRAAGIDNISLEGIARLRELILELAVRGMLVEQNVDDKPAISFFEKLIAQRNTLINEGVIKKGKLLYDAPLEDSLFKLQKNWACFKLGSLITLISGQDLAPSEYNDQRVGIPYITGASHFNKGTLEVSRWTEYPRSISYKGDLLITCKGTIGEMAFNNVGEMHIARQVMAIRNTYDINLDYVKIFLNYYVAELLEKSKSLIPGISRDDILHIDFPFPPLKEQTRIVTKVDDLMSLCDQLEHQLTRSLSTHQTLVKTLLETLTQAADADELQLAWDKISLHFNTLFCTEDSIEQLKQTLLQLAVMGRLVKQDPNDDPASELVKRIIEAKGKLVESGEIKKLESFPVIKEQEKPYKLPENWEWCRLGDISTISRGSSPRPKGDARYFSNRETEYNWITISDITNFCSNNVLYKTREYLTKEGAPLSRYVGKDVFIIAVSGSTTGKCCITGITGYIYDGLASVNFIGKAISNDYFLLYMQQYYQYINASVEGLFPNINTDFLKNLLVCIPPESEQKRIVNKVNKLFTFCESLKEKIKKSQKIKSLLSKTIIENAVV